MQNFTCSCGESYHSEEGRVACERSHVRRASRKVRAERDKLRAVLKQMMREWNEGEGFIEPETWARARALLSESTDA